jgi:ABC-type Fe3+ transport system substrate-binding protein
MFNSSMRFPIRNVIFLTLYTLVVIGVFVASLVFPTFRPIAYAPLRELLLPPPEPIVVSVLYSTEKDAWLKEVIPEFEAADYKVDGHPIKLVVKSMGSRDIDLAVLNGKEQPDLISPASSLQISILQAQSPNAFNGQTIVNAADSRQCRPVLRTPLVLVAWKERADVLWGPTPSAGVWKTLYTATTDPQGWASFGHPEWGYVKFGHTDPLKSNSGFQAILLMTYDYFGKTSGLQSADILGNPDYQKWFTQFEGTISDFGDSTGTYMKDMVAFGPSKYDVIAVYESTALEQSANAVNRYGQLQVYYPPASLWSDHPFCILSADWVTPEKAKAAQVFLDYLTSQPAQQVALKYGFRPTDPSIALDAPGSPFVQYAANGFSLKVPPEVEAPSAEVLSTLLDFWTRTVKP